MFQEIVKRLDNKNIIMIVGFSISVLEVYLYFFMFKYDVFIALDSFKLILISIILAFWFCLITGIVPFAVGIIRSNFEINKEKFGETTTYYDVLSCILWSCIVLIILIHQKYLHNNSLLITITKNWNIFLWPLLPLISDFLVWIFIKIFKKQ
jgi:hypothetical protein